MRTDELVMGHAERSDESDACGREVVYRKVGRSARPGPLLYSLGGNTHSHNSNI